MDPASTGQLIQYILLLAISTCVGWIVRVLPEVRDDVRVVKREVLGLNGKDGLIGKVADHDERLDAVDERHIKEDAVTAIEKELADGKLRRLRDRILPSSEQHP